MPATKKRGSTVEAAKKGAAYRKTQADKDKENDKLKEGIIKWGSSAWNEKNKGTPKYQTKTKKGSGTTTDQNKAKRASTAAARRKKK